MKLLRPLPRRVTRPLSILVLLAWVATMVVLVHRSFVQASSANLASDLARYGSAAQWRGVYYRNEKIGFTVSQTVATDDGLELQEDGRLQMSLLGAQTAAAIRTTARVDRAFTLQSFEFSLDPGTGRDDGSRTGGRDAAAPVGHLAERHAQRSSRDRRAAGARADPGAAPRRRRPHERRALQVDHLRSRDDVERAGRPRYREARSGAPRRTVAIRDPDVGPGISRRDCSTPGSAPRPGLPTPARSCASRARWDSRPCANRPSARERWRCPTGSARICSRPPRSCPTRSCASTTRATCSASACG